MSAGYEKAIRAEDGVPHAQVVFDPFHVVQLGGKAADQVRRDEYNRHGRSSTGEGKWIKGTRYSLLKDPAKQTAGQLLKLAEVVLTNKRMYRAFLLYGELRYLYKLPKEEAPERLEAWLAWASRSRLKPFVKLARTIRKHKPGVLAAIELNMSNGRLEALNSKVRLISHRAYGFHSADALIAMIYLCCAGIQIHSLTDESPPDQQESLAGSPVDLGVKRRRVSAESPAESRVRGGVAGPRSLRTNAATRRRPSAAGCWMFEVQRPTKEGDVRVTTAFNRMLGLPGAWVRDVAFGSGGVIVTVALRAEKPVCSGCGARGLADQGAPREALAASRSRRPVAASSSAGSAGCTARAAAMCTSTVPWARAGVVVHARLRGSRGVAGAADGQDAGHQADADRLADGREDPRAGRRREARPPAVWTAW